MDEDKDLNDAFEYLLVYGPIENHQELSDDELEKLKRFYFSGAKAFFDIAFNEGDSAEQNYGQRLASLQRRKKLMAEIKEFLE